MKNLTVLPLAALALAASFVSARAAAQTLVDPTRPPSTLMARTGTGLDAANAGPRLQSVLISPRQGGRHVAVIDGETVRLGDTYKGARVARMTQGQVELVRGRERQVLRLEPLPSGLDGQAGMAVTPN